MSAAAFKTAIQSLRCTRRCSPMAAWRAALAPSSHATATACFSTAPHAARFNLTPLCASPVPRPARVQRRGE